MPRTDRSKWDKDKTRMQVANLVTDDGIRTPVLAHKDYSPHLDKNLRVSQLFRAAARLRVFDPAADAGQKLQCANPSCSAVLHFHAASFREGDTDKNRSHFQSRNTDDHIGGCMFKNAKHDKSHKWSLRDAIAQRKPILVNINGIACGRQAPARIHYLQPDHPVTDYEGWLETTGRDGFHTESLHSIQDVLKLRARLARKYGPDVLDLLYYNNSNMVVPNAQFWMPDMLGLVREFAQYAMNVRNSTMKSVQLGPRIVAFDVAFGKGALTVNPAKRRVHGRDQLMHGSRVILKQSLYFRSLRPTEGVSIDDAERLMAGLIAENGHHLYVMATPTIVLPADVIERSELIQRFQRAANDRELSAINPVTLPIDWAMDPGFKNQVAPRPADPAALAAAQAQAYSAAMQQTRASGGKRGKKARAAAPAGQLTLFG